MSKRITLRAVYKIPEGDLQPGASFDLDDTKADELIKAGKAILSPTQVVYTHEDVMPVSERDRSQEALLAADAVAGYAKPQDQVARAVATAPFRK